ncbi:hypothetical protein BOX15_Mlig004751g1 [Macrostomum lignano]|uniref:BIG2 domain-containing protein n=1 Tax=Macrostomum lignano TaxID=282301 RepID=A0A267ENN5_9PLAT|nr:hypothetical protein BOX15_Mlig004751g1 [Macrostomum lignano]
MFKVAHQIASLFLLLSVIEFKAYLTLDFRISTSKVLLPYSSYVPINYTLVAESEARYCYLWTSTSPEVATVTPLHEDCSQSAIITATWKNPYRASTAILVENIMTGHTVKCDVIVDKPSRLEIETTTQELYLHDAPEALVVRAYDDLGNIFSSLTGLPFEWSITSAHGVDGLNILRFISWTESEYEIPSVIGNLESQGLQGDQQLVGGIKTGSAFVGVSVKDTIYAGVAPGKVRLLVMANAILKPSLAYLIPGASLNYQVLVFHQGNLNEVAMPSQQYYLNLNDKTKATLDTQTSRLTARELGEVEVSLYDRNIEETETFKRPKSIVSIVEPSYLTFTALPGRRWVLDTTRAYTVIIDIFDRNSHRIWPSDDLRLKAVFPTDRLRVLESSSNGTWHLVQPLRPGPCLITASLAAIQTPDGVRHELPAPVTGSQEVEIYDPVSVLPERVVLPWTLFAASAAASASTGTLGASSALPGSSAASSSVDASTASGLAASSTVAAGAGGVVTDASPSACRLQATGGSGEYSWLSSNASAVVVSSRGVVTAMSIGQAVVTAADVRNTDNAARSEIVVAQPTGMAFLPATVEAEIGATLRLPIALYSGRDPMCSCSHAPIDLAFEDDAAVFELVAGLEQQLSANCRDCAEHGCATVVVRALRKGFSRLVARYRGAQLSASSSSSSSSGAPALISAEVMLGAFKPLRPLASSFVVSLGAMETVEYRGGPQPWVLDPATYRVELSPAGDGSKQSVETVPSKDQHTGRSAFVVRCVELGEFQLALSVSNLPSAKNKFPAKRSVQVSFVCAVPTSLRLQPLLNLPTRPGLPPCPAVLEDPSLPVPVHNYRPVSLRLAALDAEGRQFTSLASLAVTVSTSDSQVATAAVADDSTPVPLIRVQPNNKNATVQITVTLSGYKTAYREWTSTVKQPPVSASAQLRTAGDATAQPGQLISYYGRGRASAYLADGSGHFYATAADQIGTSGSAPTIQGRFLTAGSERETESTVTVYDLCMDRVTPLEVPLLVVALRSLRLIMEDRLPLGGRETGSLSLLGRGDRPIPTRLIMDAGLPLSLRSEPPGLVSVAFDAAASKASNEGVGVVSATGDAVGVARVQAECQGVRSNWAQVSVYPPLRLRPANVTLLVGSQLQLQAVGGPPAAALRFSALLDGASRRFGSAAVAAVSQAGLVDATAEGRVQVRVESVGFDSTGSARVFSTAYGWVSVVPLAELRVHAPVAAIKVGNCVPLWAVAQGGVGPIALATVTPAMYFHWSLDGEGQVGSLTHLLSHLGQPLRAKRMSAGVRLCGLSPGQAVVRLRLHRDQNQQRPQHQAELSIRVVAALSVPGVCAEPIRMAPGSSYDLSANRKAGDLRYSLIETAQPVSHYQQQHQQQVVTLSSSGQLTALNSHGSSLLTVSAESRWANQTLTMRVDICPIAYLMLQYDGPELPRMRADLHHLPTGGLYGLRVAAFTALGDPIHAANPPLTAHASRLDFVQLSDFANQSFSLRAIAKGCTAFQVSHNGLQDFAVVFTAPAIEPHDVQISAGTVLCFSSPFLHGEELSWASTNPQSLAVLPDTGLAVALAPGKSAVFLAGRRFSASADVLVSEPTDLSASAPPGSLLSDSGHAPPVFITVGPAAPVASLAAAAFAAGNCTGGTSGGSSTPKLSPNGVELLSSLLQCQAQFSDEVSSHRAASGLPVLHAEPTLVSGGRLACLVRVQPPPAAAAAPWWDADSDDSDNGDRRHRLPHVVVTAELPRAGAAAPPVSIPLWPAVRLASTPTPTLDEDGVAELRLLVHPAARQGLSVQAARPDLLRVSEPRVCSDAQADNDGDAPAATPIAGCLTVSLRLTPTALDGLSTSQDAVTVASSAASVADLRVIVRHQRTRQNLDLPVRPHPSLLRSAGGSRSTARSDSATDAIGLSDASNRGLLYIGIGALIALLVIGFTARLLQPPRLLMADPAAAGVGLTPPRGTAGAAAGADSLGARSSLDRSGAVLWSQGYGYTSSADFSPVSPYRRSPNTSGFGSRSRLAD